MNKAIKYAKKGAIIFGVGNAALNLIKQLTEMNENPDQKFDWKRLLIAAGKGAVAGGAGGWLIGSVEDHNNSKIAPVDTNAFLYSVVHKVKLNKEDRQYLNLQEKADLLIGILKSEYAGELASEPFRIGSTEKGIALRNKFDIDIALSFKKNSFRSTAEMFDDLGDFLESLIGKYSIVRVRDQRVSIGVLFSIYGKEYKVDVVPKKKSSSSKKNTSGYLFVNDSNFWMDNSTYTKTDFHALKNVRLTEGQKKIVIILKHWKIKNKVPISSHLLEALVLDAYEANRYRIPRGLTEKVIMVLRYIADNLDVAVIRSVENTNNVLTNISPESKSITIEACVKAVQDYEYQPNSVIEAFKV
ncbi:MAG: hypothetical protein ACK4E0_08705 [Chitinophagaceae bacterium]